MDATERFERAQAAVLAANGLDAEQVWVDTRSAGRTHVLEVGSGPPVVFVIGGGAPAVMWAPLVAELSGYRCLLVDRPGFGLTDNMSHRREGLRARAAEFLRETLDGLELDAVPVVANSMGAWWSTQLALREPARVRSMVHIGCPALLLDTSAPLPMRFVGVRGLGRLMVRLQPASPATARQTFAMMGDPLDDAAGARAMADLMVATMQQPAYVEAWSDLLHAYLRPRGQRPGMAIGEAELRRLDLPLLYVWGRRDPFGGPEVGRRAAAVAPRGHLVEVADGHVPWISDPVAVAAPIREHLLAHASEPQRRG